MDSRVWSDIGAGEGLTLAGNVGADAMATLLPQATVASLLSDPVVGSSGQYCEDAGQEIKQIASSLKAPLHPHAKEAAAKDIKVGPAHTLACGGGSSTSEGLPPQALLPGDLEIPNTSHMVAQTCNPSTKEAEARD